MDDPLGGAAALSAHLDAPLPQEVAVGRGSALFVCGWGYCPAAPIRSLAFLYDGEMQEVAVHGMPRLDPFRQLHPGIDPFAATRMSGDPQSPEDPNMLSYRSGFWGLLRIGPAARGGEHKLLLRAELPGGGTAMAELAGIRTINSLTPPGPVASPATGAALIAICMATHNPPRELLARQLQSIRAQTYSNWVCLVSDDCSKRSCFEALREEIAEDPRFVLDRSPRRLGFYRNFERALSMAPADAAFVALADQDDRWYPEKLATLLREVGDAQLIYSDARIVARDGRLVSETYWSRRRNNHSNILSLLVANAVTGAASLFRRELLDYALPFPPGQFSHYHDHWIASTALALGEIRFINRPLYDYVQHGGASLGHARANLMPTLRDRLATLRARSLRDRMRKWRMHYFVDIARLMQFAAVLEMRCGERIAPRKRRAIHRLMRADRSLLTPLLFALRGLRELFGRKETLGAEWMLFGALLWHRLLTLSARDRPQRRLRLDAVPPPSLAPGPARVLALEGTSASAVAEKLAPLDFQLRDDAPRRVNLLIPTIDLDHLFGGYIAKLNLARRLAERGAAVRVVTVDPTPPLPRSWRRQLESYSGLSGLADRVELVFGRESQGIEVSASDAFIATTWWTAHIARVALSELGGRRFLYMIQEYEPFTFPMGTFAALARESYEAPHAALFSTELLRDYFRRHRIGVYADGVEVGDRASAAFENSITSVEAPRADELAARSTRRLLFYARPEPHAARNMFELGVLALSRAMEEGAFQQGWELRGIGTVESGRRLPLSGDLHLELMPRAGQDRYAQLLPEHDLGLALMYTPHPSLVPIEMASAGMLVVTNSFENKTPEAMAGISSNLLTAEPTIEGVAGALREAAAGVDDVERRVRGSRVRWSRDWDQSFDDGLLAQIEAFLTW
jgi:glycosyltransferase involved in cell wall biosynthesis